MKHLAVLAICALTLSACQSTSDTVPVVQSGVQLATQNDMEAITGKTLTLNAGQSYVIYADGTMNGSWNGKPVIGTYEMRDGYFCRTLSQGPRGPSAENCQLFILDGNKLHGRTNRGTGSSFTYTIS